MKIIIIVNYFWENAPSHMFHTVLNIPGFWVYQSSEYAMILNISRLRICFLFCIYQGSKYVRVKEGSEDAYASLCLNMSECARICVNILSSAWMAFVLNFFIAVPVFLKRQTLIFPKVAGSIWFAFRLRLNIFGSKISNLLLLLGREGLGPQIMIHTIYLWWFFNNLFIYFCCCCCCCCWFSTFWCFRGLNQKLAKAVVL